jgi:hypothetical protein
MRRDTVAIAFWRWSQMAKGLGGSVSGGWIEETNTYVAIFYLILQSLMNTLRLLTPVAHANLADSASRNPTLDGILAVRQARFEENRASA